MGKQRKTGYLTIGCAGIAAVLLLISYIIGHGAVTFEGVLNCIASIAVLLLIIGFGVVSFKQKKYLLTLAFAIKAVLTAVGAKGSAEVAIEYGQFTLYEAALILFALAWIAATVLSLGGFSFKKYGIGMLLLLAIGSVANLYIAYDQINFALEMREFLDSTYVVVTTLQVASDLLLGAAVVLLGIKKEK